MCLDQLAASFNCSAFMDELDDDDFRFIRIGEGYGHTEVRGGFTENPFDLELGRSITFSQAV